MAQEILSRVFYFGHWAKQIDGKPTRGDDRKESLEIYRSHVDDLHAGRTPRIKTDSLTVADCVTGS